MIYEVDGLLLRNDFSLNNKNVVLAVSGGMDSMSMLVFFVNNKEYYGIKNISVAHFNHGLRIFESDKDEEFVKQYSASIGIGFLSERGKMSSLDKPKSHTMESWARELRYDFLNRCSQEKDAVILTAHTMNDVAETVVFNMIRGMRFTGASGIPFQNRNVIRPFLFLSRNQISEYVKQHEIPYINDSTNYENNFSRNRIRNLVFPELLKINSKAAEHIFAFSSFVKDANEYFVKEARKLILNSIVEGDKFKISILLDADPLILSYMIKEILHLKGIENIYEKHINLAIDVVNGLMKTVDLNKDYMFCSDCEFVYFIKKETMISEPFNMVAKIGVNITPFGIVYIAKHNINGNNDSLYTSQNTLDYDKIKGTMYLRSRLPSDKFSSKQRGQTKSLKKLFNERMIPISMRDQIPLLVDDNGIIFIPGEGTSRLVETDEKTNTILIISMLEVFSDE